MSIVQKCLGHLCLGMVFIQGKGGSFEVEGDDVPVQQNQGLHLYFQKVSLHHPVRIGEMVSSEISEPFRFTRTRSRTLKGFEWGTRNA